MNRRDETTLHERGCYGCGRWPVRFGGSITPPIWNFDGVVFPGEANWWTECPDCGVVEVHERV